jgi:hypothetical protein
MQLELSEGLIRTWKCLPLNVLIEKLDWDMQVEVLDLLCEIAPHHLHYREFTPGRLLCEAQEELRYWFVNTYKWKKSTDDAVCALAINLLRLNN